MSMIKFYCVLKCSKINLVFDVVENFSVLKIIDVTLTLMIIIILTCNAMI